MDNEIKEILDRIKNYPEKLYCLNNKEKRSLLDYITNLQQENEILKLNDREWQLKYDILENLNDVFETLDYVIDKLKDCQERIIERNKINIRDL